MESYLVSTLNLCQPLAQRALVPYYEERFAL